MEKSESFVQREIIRYLESCGFYVLKLIQTNKNGIPDLLAIRNGEAIFIEVKRPGAGTRPLQQYRINELQQQGIKAFVAHSVQDLITDYRHSENSQKVKK